MWDVKCSYEHTYGWLVEAGSGEAPSKSSLHDVVSQCLSALLSSLVMEELSLWKSGLYFRSRSEGILEILVEASQDMNSFCLLIRAQKFSPSCLRLRSIIMKVIRQSFGKNKGMEWLVDPFDAMHYPLPSKENLTLFTFSDVIYSLQSGDSNVKSNGKVTIPLSELVYFDPFVLISNDSLSFLSQVQPKDSVSEHFLQSLTLRMFHNIDRLSLFSHIFSFNQIEFSPSVDEIHCTLVSWARNKGYTDLIRLLTEYSVLNVQDFLSSHHFICPG